MPPISASLVGAAVDTAGADRGACARSVTPRAVAISTVKPTMSATANAVVLAAVFAFFIVIAIST
jgi:hypothetical protein